MTHKTQLQYYIFVMKPILSQFCTLTYLAIIAAIQNSNLFTDIIFYWHHVKEVLVSTVVKSPLPTDNPNSSFDSARSSYSGFYALPYTKYSLDSS